LPKLRDVPTRAVTGAYILHAGLEKWDGTAEQAAGVRGMASSAFPFLEEIPAERFLRLVAAGELATGTLLVAPMIPSEVAGAALTAFSGMLLGMYARAPGLRKPGSIWPTQSGIGVSKDVWMLAIGLGLLLESATRRSRG
jgi:hypothetical protein